MSKIDRGLEKIARKVGVKEFFENLYSPFRKYFKKKSEGGITEINVNGKTINLESVPENIEADNEIKKFPLAEKYRVQYIKDNYKISSKKK